jgi:SAM-dependent methyltransferase
MLSKGGQPYSQERVARLFDEPAETRGARRKLVAAEGTLPRDADELAFERLDLCRNDVLLDVGTGDGRLAIRAARICRRVIGIDISRRSLERARVSAREEDLTNVSFAYGAFEDPCSEADLSSCRINKILAAYALHHLPDTLKEKSLGALVSLLQRPGRVAIGDLMFFEDPAQHEDDWDNVAYDGGEYDFPAPVGFLTDVLKRLACISHRLSAASPDTSAPAALRSVGLLNVSPWIRLRWPRSQALQAPPSPPLRDDSR